MDDIIERAIMEDEIARCDFDCWQVQRERQQDRDQRQAGHEAEQLIVRQWLASEQSQETTMDAETSRAWNEWCRDIARIEAIKLDNDLVDDLEKFSDALQARFDRRNAYFEKQDADLRTEIETLKTSVVELANEIRDLRAAGEGNGTDARGNVIPILTLKGGRDAA
jgi:beta-galactosidase GanA